MQNMLINPNDSVRYNNHRDTALRQLTLDGRYAEAFLFTREEGERVKVGVGGRESDTFRGII